MGFGASPKKPRAIGPDKLFITAVFVGVSTEMSTRREIFRREMWEARRSCSRPVTAPAITERSCTAQPAACAALGLLPMSVAGWAVGCAFAAVILLLEMWLWCRSCDANQSQPIDGVLDAACQGEPAHSERFNGAPVRRLELEPSGR